MVIVYMIQFVLAFATRHITIPYADFTHWFAYIFPPFRLGDYIMGVCLGFIYTRYDFKKSVAFSSVLETAAIVLALVASWMYVSVGHKWFCISLNYALSSLLLIFVFAEHNGIITKALSIKPLVYLGNISGEAFLLHQITMKYVSTIGNHWFSLHNAYIVGIISFVVTVICSQLWRKVTRQMKAVK